MSKHHAPFRILGVDPGTQVTGYAILETQGSQLRLVDIGTIQIQRLNTAPEKLSAIFQNLQSLIERHQPHEMAIEAPFFGKNVQSMLKLGRAQGIAIAAALSREVPFYEYSPKSIKKAVTGRGNAAKEQVSAMLDQLLQRKLEAETLDATDALAAAVCHHFSRGNLPSGQGKKYSGWGDFLKNNPERGQ
jgi:crossover junction endodeoxyribonuclease RuvC